MRTKWNLVDTGLQQTSEIEIKFYSLQIVLDDHDLVKLKESLEGAIKELSSDHHKRPWLVVPLQNLFDTIKEQTTQFKDCYDAYKERLCVYNENYLKEQ